MIYGYIRVSTDRQDTENQKLGVINKAKQLGREIEAWITDDGISGTKEPEERALGKLLKRIKPGDVIITSELSRLGRKLFMIMRILEHCMKIGAKVYTVKDGYELGDNIQSKVLAFAFGLAAEIERDMISQRTKEALARIRKEGVVLGRPVGSKSKKLKLADKETQIKRYISAGLSYAAIARLLKCNRMTVRNICMRENWHKEELTARAEKYRRNHTVINAKRIKISESRFPAVDEILELYKKSFSIAKLAEEFNCPQSAIISYLKRNNGYERLQVINTQQRQKVKSKAQLERENNERVLQAIA
jgi:DNA invertase Pin-like site-specific DNA recombinase